MGHLKKIYGWLIGVWSENFIQIGAVTMSSSKESSVHMRIYGLAKNILIVLLKKRKKQNSILVMTLLISAGRIFYCLRIFLVK